MTSEKTAQRLWTAKDFVEYVNLRWRHSLFRKKCYWYSTGSIVSCETGKVIALLEGLEWGNVRSITRQTSNHGTVEAVVSSKKLYFLKDPETGTYLNEQVSRTKKFHPIFYPQQDTRLVWSNHSIDLKRDLSVFCKTLGARVINLTGIRVYSLPTFIKLHTKRSGYVSTLENYDLYRCTNFFGKFFTSPTLWWTRYGDCPSWYGKGKCASYLVSKKVNNIHSLPKEFLSHVRNYDPLLLEQPLADGRSEHSNENKRILGERSLSK